MTGMLEMLVVCPFLIILRIFGTGIALSWFLSSPGDASRPTAMRRVIYGSRALLVGTLVTALLVFVLGQTGLYGSRWLEWVLLVAVSLCGLLPAVLRCREKVISYGWDCMPLALTCFFGIAVIMALPERTEWLFGGWDPGVYTSEGVALARTGTFYPDDSQVYGSLSRDEQDVFTRTGRGRTERFPGVVVDAQREGLSYEFFRLHPSVIAMFCRSGGVVAAVRGNSVLAMFVAFLFFSLLVEHTHATHACVATVLLMAQPIWLYHSHVPVSEMLHLFLLVGIGLMIPHRGKGIAASVLLALLFLALILNRFSFLPFAGIVLCAVAVADVCRCDRGRVASERALQIMAIICGVCLDWWAAPASLAGWSSSVLPRLMGVTGGFFLLALGVDVLALNAEVRRRTTSTPRWMLIVGGWLCVGILLVMYSYGRWGGGGKDADNLYRLLPYLGYITVLVAAIGGLMLVHRPHAVRREMGAFIVALLGMVLIVLIKKWVRDLYPWATRRYLSCAVPLVAILAAYPVSVLWKSQYRVMLCRVAGVSLLALILIGNAKRSWHAWFRVESHGALVVLDQLAAQIEEEDVVVVDNPVWGTPLRLIYGKNVLNGKHMWRRKDSDQMMVGLGALKRLHEGGKRIRFLTTTEDMGMSIYPVRVERARLDWQLHGPVLEKINHSSRANDFHVKEKGVFLRLFTWCLDVEE